MKLISPVYFKEIGQIATNRRSFWLKFVYVGLLLLLFGAFLADSVNGMEMFQFTGFVLIFSMVILTPLVTAGVVCGEKEAGTLGLLFITRLTAWNIVQDKGLSRLTYMAYIALLTFPFFFGALLYGGVDNIQVIAVIAQVISVIIFCGGISLFFSTVLKKFSAALAVTYTALLAFYLLLPLCLFLLDAFFDESDVMFVSPFVSLVMVLENDLTGNDSQMYLSFGSNILISIVVYLLCITCASLLLRRVAFSENYAKPPKEKSKPSSPASSSEPSGGWTQWPIFRRSRRPGKNPIAWKDFNLFQDHLRKVLFILGLILFIIYLIFAIATTGNNSAREVVHIVAIFIYWIFAAGFSAILAANGFTREKESRTFEILLSTRLTGQQIVRGVFIGTVRSLLPIWFMLFAIGIWAIFDKLGNKTPVATSLLMVINMMVYGGLIIVVGLYFSLVCRSTARSTGWTLITLLLVCIGPPIIGLMVAMGMNPLEEFSAALSPAVWIIVCYLDLNDISQLGGYTTYFIVTGMFGFITWILFANMSARFDQATARQSSKPDKTCA